ncbi:MBL fold metallo-hydrolase [Mesorhizobium marinum]|uniref:MBL fold metallo-hydrolase n=1 Tax=Mesorhizobium marinum TaxID=3228790 RepID=UPI0034653773
MLRRLALMLVAFLSWPTIAPAASEAPPSRCVAIAQALPSVTLVRFDPAGAGPLLPVQAAAGDAVTISYAGHSTYVIETPGGVRIATDFSGFYGGDPLPRVVTMNKAHRTHFTEAPDPRIEHVLRGWSPDGGSARHALVVDDVYIRNVTTDIRGWGGELERDGNSIFIFEVAGLCIGHLGHLHTGLSDAQYGQIGRLDIVMVPIDGGMTQSIGSISEITTRLYSSMILPMHRHSTPIGAFTAMMGEEFEVEFRPSRSLSVSLRTLPSRPTVVVLDGV